MLFLHFVNISEQNKHFLCAADLDKNLSVGFFSETTEEKSLKFFHDDNFN